MQFEGSSDVSQCDHQRSLECVRIETSLNHERESSELNQPYHMIDMVSDNIDHLVTCLGIWGFDW